MLFAAGIPPSGRRSELTWKQFLAAHAETLVAADFFSISAKRLVRFAVQVSVYVAEPIVSYVPVAAPELLAHT